MSTKAFLGVDPGMKGAIAWITEDGQVFVKDMPVLSVGKKNKNDVQKQLEIVKAVKDEWPDVVGAIEIVHAMKGQGVTSTFTFGEGYGMNQACLYALGIPFDYVTPQRWKKELMHGMAKEKAASCLTASRLFPEYRDLFFGPQGGAKDGRADAVLIAEFRRRLG